MSAVRQLVQNNPLNMLRLLAAVAPQQLADKLSQLGIYVAPTESDVEKVLISLAEKKEKEKLKWLLVGLRIPADDLSDETKQVLFEQLDAREEATIITRESTGDSGDSGSGDTNNDNNNNDSGNNSTTWLELGVGVTGFLTSLFGFLSARNDNNNNTQNNGNNSDQNKSDGKIWLYVGIGVLSLVMIITAILILKK